MFARASQLWACVVFVLVSSFAPRAGAWVETLVRGHEARVEVEAGGKATVHHELVLKIRGGPMKLLEIGGMGTNIEPLPDATVRRAVEGSASLWPLSASSQEDGSLRLKIGAPRGIRGGSYLFSFGYTVNLEEAGLVEPKQNGFEISWIGPRLSSGVDSARVTFVVPRGSERPRISESSEGLEANVLLGELRRGESHDEIELVRAHLATGEPAVWRVWVSSDALSDMPEVPVAGPASRPIPQTREQDSSWLSGDRARHLRLSGLLALIFGVLLYFKARTVDRLCRLTESRSKPLIGGAPWLRALLGCVVLGGASWFALDHQPTPAAVLGVVAAALGTYLLPVRVVRPRGPGAWEELTPEDAKEERLPGALFESRSVPGFLLCGALIACSLFAAYRILPASNYLALMTLSLSVVVVPTFWTGQRRDFPQSPYAQARPWYDKVRRAWDGQRVAVQLWGRRPSLDGKSARSCDEARVRMVLDQPKAGLRAFEIAFDEAAGSHVMPCVVLRVLEDSPALAALPRDLPWRRGRTAEERVALLRPAAPTHAQLLRLLRSLVTTLRSTKGLQTSPVRSRGGAERAVNLGTPAAAPLM